MKIHVFKYMKKKARNALYRRAYGLYSITQKEGKKALYRRAYVLSIQYNTEKRQGNALTGGH